MLSSSDGMQRGRSGYNLLADYVPGARLVEVQRTEPKGLIARAMTAVIRRCSISSWYRLSSLRLETRAWRILHKERSQRLAVHFLWADRNLGWLDLMLHRPRQRLVCTFHACPDTLPELINFPSRLRRIEGVVLMSQVQRSFFEAAGVPPERIHV